MPLSERQRRFVEAFMGAAEGNATEAAVLAGYARVGAHVTASRLLRNPKIVEAIGQRVDGDSAVADREERQRFLTATMRNCEENTEERLKACNLLAKSQGDYVTRVQLEGVPSLRVVLDDRGR